MSSCDPTSRGVGFIPAPTTANGWLEKWSLEMVVRAPTDNGTRHIEIANIESLPGEGAKAPDLLVTTKAGNQFYIVFDEGRVFRPYNLPALIWPPTWGENRAIWIL